MSSNSSASEGRPQISGGELTDSPEIMYKIFEYAPDAILLIDSQGRIAKVNTQFEKMFGYRREEIVGQFVEALIPQRFSKRHLGFRSNYIASPHMRPMGFGLELLGKRKDDSEFPVDIMLSPLSANGDNLVLAVIRDATERRRVEAQAQEAGEMYIKEIHHRVKNNLQVISSLLFLQSTYLTDASILNILKESQSRVKSIALIHEKLYRSTDLSRLDFSEYVNDLVMNLFRTYGVNQEGIGVRTHVQNVRLEVDTAIPCGLIINELVSNVLKHAFPNESGGEVVVELGPMSPGEFLLTVRDNGVGLPEGFDWRASSSLGLKLVMDLTRQLDGKVEVHVDNGTIFRITFRELHYKERR